MAGRNLQISGDVRVGFFGAGAAVRVALAWQVAVARAASHETRGSGHEFAARHPHIVTVAPQGEVRTTTFAASRQRLADRADRPDMRFRGGKP